MGVQTVLQDIQSGYLSATVFTSNNNSIVSSFDKTLDRTDSVNNAMLVDLDMGLKNQINLKDGINPKDGVNLSQVQNLILNSSTGLISRLHEPTIIATANQELVNFTSISYVQGVNNLMLFVNGIAQVSSSDYTETSATSVTFTTPLNLNDKIDAYVNESTTSLVTNAQNVNYIHGSTTSVDTALNKKANRYATISELSLAADIVIGDKVEISSYTATNNSGLLQGEIVAGGTGIEDGGSYINLVLSKYQFKQNFTTVPSIKQFGAEGDGITDDTIPAKYFAQYVSLNSNAGYIPKGTYFLTDHFNFNSSVALFGDGKGISTIKVGAWIDGIRVSNGYPSPSSVIDNVLIMGISIDGNRTGYVNGTSDTYGNGININACDKVTIRDCEVYNVAEQGIVSTYWEVPAGTVQTQLIITNNTVTNCQLGRTSIGLEGVSSNGIVENNSINNAGGVGIYIGYLSGTGIDAKNNKILNNSVVSSLINTSYGIKIEDNIYNSTILGNTIEGFDISIRCSSVSQATDGYLIKNNTCTGWVSAGIATFPSFNSAPSKAIVSGNIIDSVNASGSSYGILAGAGTVSQGNIIRSGTTGIGCAGDSHIIKGNTITSGVTGYAVDTSNSLLSSITENILEKDINISQDTIVHGNFGYATQRWSNTYFGNMQNITGTGIPTTGTFNVGDRIWNTLPSASGVIGWVCTVAGTPGTWKSFGTIAA